jgi:hypothetical protein
MTSPSPESESSKAATENTPSAAVAANSQTSANEISGAQCQTGRILVVTDNLLYRVACALGDNVDMI